MGEGLEMRIPTGFKNESMINSTFISPYTSKDTDDLSSHVITVSHRSQTNNLTL